MSQELERVYTIPLGKVLLSANTHRAVRAINMIKEFARRHMKTYNVKIDEEVSHIIWARGVRSPPRKIRVKMTKTEEGHILVSPYEDEIESDVIPEKESTPKATENIEAEKSEEIYTGAEKYQMHVAEALYLAMSGQVSSISTGEQALETLRTIDSILSMD